MTINHESLAAAERIARVESEYSRRMARPTPDAGRAATMMAAEAREDAAKASATTAKTREQFVAEYRSSADLQREFNSADVFIAYAIAEQAGRVRIIAGRVVS